MTPAAAIAYVRHVAHNPAVPTFVRLCRGRDGVRVNERGEYEIDCLDTHGRVTARIEGALPTPLSGCAEGHALDETTIRVRAFTATIECVGDGHAVMAATFR